MSTRIIRWASVLLLVCVVVPLTVQAAGFLPDCNPVPSSTADGRETCQVKHLIELMVNVYNFLLGLAAFVAILFIIYAGVQMAVFYISETPSKNLEAAKLTLSRAITGFVIIACAYLIVNITLGFLGLADTKVAEILRDFGLLQ